MATFSDKIRIRLKAYDYRILDQSTTELVGRLLRPTESCGNKLGKSTLFFWSITVSVRLVLVMPAPGLREKVP